jgi:hypothetical protein
VLLRLLLALLALVRVRTARRAVFLHGPLHIEGHLDHRFIDSGVRLDDELLVRLVGLVLVDEDYLVHTLKSRIEVSLSAV